MATIAQEPNKYNSAYVPNVWVLDNIGSADRYVLTVTINGSNVATFKQPANPAGVGIFDISKVLQSYLQTGFVEETQYAADTPGVFESYQVSYGTETGFEVAYDGLSDTKHVINAYDNWRVLNSDLTPFLPNPTDELCENSNINARYASPLRFLTNFPGTYKVRSNEYKTLSFFARNTNIGPNWGPNEAPFFVLFTYYLNGSQVAQGVYTLSQFRGSSLRTNCQDMTVNISDDNAITTIGVGPQNQADAGISGNWDSYKVEVYSYNNCMTTTIADCQDFGEILTDGYLGDVIYRADFVIEDACTAFDPITVSFMNQYGVRDYHTFDRRNTRTTTTSRNNYNKTLGSWSASSFSIDPVGRGKTTFSSEVVTNMTLSTNWMDDETSKWLEELFVSPSTMIYVDGAWEPCVITTTNYDQRTYARSSMFQHEIEVEFSNNKNIQRG